MAKVYFITEKYLKDKTDIATTVSMDKIDFLPETVYDMQIKFRLGTYFANYLLEKHQLVITGNDTYTPTELELVKLIQKVMAWYICYNTIITLSWQTTNSGTTQNFGDYQQAVQDPTIMHKMDRMKQNGDFYLNQLERYICKNSKDLPQFTDKLNDDANINCCLFSNDTNLGIMFI